jgi:hypothetical protein
MFRVLFQLTGRKWQWRRQHNEELHNFYIFPSIVRVIRLWRKRWVGYVACMDAVRNAYKVLVGKP